MMILDKVKVPLLFIFQYLVLSNVLDIALNIMLQDNLPNYVLLTLNGLLLINNWFSFGIIQAFSIPFIGYRFLIQKMVFKLNSTIEFNDSWTLTIYLLAFYIPIIIVSLYCVNQIIMRLNKQILLELEDNDEPSNIVTGNDKEYNYDIDSKENIFSDKTVESVEQDISQLKDHQIEYAPPIPPRPSPEAILHAKKPTLMNRLEQFKESKLTPYWKQLKEKSLSRFTKQKTTENTQILKGTDEILNNLIAVINSRNGNKSSKEPELEEIKEEVIEEDINEVKEPEPQEVKEPEPKEVKEPEPEEVKEPEPEEVKEPEPEEVKEAEPEEIKEKDKEVKQESDTDIFLSLEKDVQQPDTTEEVVVEPVKETELTNVSLDDVMLMPFKGKMYYINDIKGLVYDAIPENGSHKIGKEAGTCNMGTMKLYESESNFNPVFG